MQDILKKDKAHVWHPFTQVQTAGTPIAAISAKDSIITDINGKTYIDSNSSWWTILHGHGNEYIGNAIKDQFLTLDHTVFAGITHPKAVEAAERIVGKLPSKFNKVFFSDNGSTSTEVALKMTFQYWHNKGQDKKKILAIHGAYHGDTFGAMSVGERDHLNAPFESLFFDVDYLPFPTEENWEDVYKIAKSKFETENYAGFIFEPLVQGASGMRMYKPEWLDQLLQLAHDNETITIADEVMTGFYRLGTLFAIDQLKVKPEIICLSKGVTGGVLPIGLTITSDRIHDSFLSNEFARGFLHGHSFTGNPLACAAICASLDLLEQKETIDKIDFISTSHKDFKKKIDGHPKIENIRHLGTIIAIELKIDGTSGYFSSIRSKAYNYFIEKGLIIRPLGNVFFVNPPYCIKEEELEYTYDTIIDFLNNEA